MWRGGERIDRAFLLRASLLACTVLGLALPGLAGATGSYATITNVTYRPTEPNAPSSCSAMPSLSGSGSEFYDTPDGARKSRWEWTVPATLAAGAKAHIQVMSQSLNNGGSSDSIAMSAPSEFGTTPSTPSQVDAIVPVGAPGQATAQQSFTFKPTRDFVTGEKLYLVIGYACANFVYEYTGHAAPSGCSASADARSALTAAQTCTLPLTPRTKPPLAGETTSYAAPETYTDPVILPGLAIPASAVSATVDVGMSRDGGKLLNPDDFVAAVENGDISGDNVHKGVSICASEYFDVRVGLDVWFRVHQFTRCVSVVAQILQRAEKLRQTPLAAIDARAACRFRLARLKGARHAPRVRLTCTRTRDGVRITIRPTDRGRKLRSLIGRSPSLIIGRLRSTEPVRPRDRVNVRWTTSKH